MSKILILGLLVFGFSAHAAPTPLIKKVNASGFTPPEYRQTETCEIYSNRAVVTFEMGSANGSPVKMRRIYPVSFTANIRDMIQAASQEQVQTDTNSVCDAPTTVVTAATAGVPSFFLFRSASCGNQRQERIGGHSFQLRAIVDEFCPKTNDYGHNE